MRLQALIAGFLMITSCYAWEIIQETQKQLTEESLKLEDIQDARIPAVSKATPGKVFRHKVQPIAFSSSLFIIGDDALSRQWLREHAQELEEKQALGFITNIDSTSSFQEIQALTKAPLLPANVDGLLALFRESHYPFIFYGGEIWQ